MQRLMAALSVLAFSTTAWAQAESAQVVSQLSFDRPNHSAGATLRISGPDGLRHEQHFAAGEAIDITTRLSSGQVLVDGHYRWELLLAPQLSQEQQQWADQRKQGTQYAKPSAWPERVAQQSGAFTVLDGAFVDKLFEESLSRVDNPDGEFNTAADASQIPNPQPRQVIAEDLIVQGSTCVGIDCANGESFGFDTLRLKENNLRIHFDDTSASASFPGNDWQLVANDTDNGGLNRFTIRDSTAGRDLFTIEAGGVANALYVDDGNHVGIGTNTPVTSLHAADGNTPTVRLDQNGTDGFTPQIWDLAGNEAGFFVRNTTSGSTLPFRVLAGSAPTNSLVIDASGDIAMGPANASAALHIQRNSSFTDPWLLLAQPDDGNANTDERLVEVDANGNLFVGGTITQLSSRFSKENLIQVASQDILGKLSQLPIWTWNYLHSQDSDRHIGPVAEDFYRQFGFGTSERSVAPADMAGVALAATQALQQEIAQRDAKIATLESRLARLEALLMAQQESNGDAQ
ncbi:MAG: tail fiber domain-containing protein [Xanthomonadales bacterium]|nr:tail fiber domain-containing protein [Xanthomonadales bacterium]